MSVARLSLVALLAAACARTETAADPLPDLQRWVSGAEGFDTTSWWLDTGSEVVVFDAQFTPALAEALIADIEARTDSPITTLVVTHPNPDKFNGATAFQAIGAEVIASAATALAMPGVHAYKEAYFTSVGAFEPGAYPALPEVDRTFGDRLALDLDGAAVELLVLDAPGVTTTQTVALVGDGRRRSEKDVKHSTWRQRPAATASIASTTTPSWPATSWAPQCHVGRMPSACSRPRTPPREIPGRPSEPG